MALSGAAMQGIFRNPLVSPDIVGVSAGAACGGVIAILLGFSIGPEIRKHATFADFSEAAGEFLERKGSVGAGVFVQIQEAKADFANLTVSWMTSLEQEFRGEEEDEEE